MDLRTSPSANSSRFVIGAPCFERLIIMGPCLCEKCEPSRATEVAQVGRCVEKRCDYSAQYDEIYWNGAPSATQGFTCI